MAVRGVNFVPNLVVKPGSCLPLRFLIAGRGFSCCTTNLAGEKFRKSQGKARDSLEYGPLTDLPDWTYLDGTPPPLTRRQLTRQKQRIETSNRVVTFLKEINAAKASHQEKKSEQSENKEKTT